MQIRTAALGETDQQPRTRNSEQAQDQGITQEQYMRVEQWIQLCIPYKGIVRVIQVPVPERKDDFTLFKELRKEYFKRSTPWARFSQLKAVTKVEFAMVSTK